jgi:nucleoside-diphosphate-sugar epimerase
MATKRPTVLVTGGGGYVGAVLVPKLLARDYRVRVIDLFLFGTDVLPKHPALELVKADIRDEKALAKVTAGVDSVIHYASTSSVYGVSDAPDVTEDHPLVPLTDYNKYKGMCEPILLRYQAPGFTTVIIRPATVCGYSPRQRLDLTVNILTSLAVNQRRITIFGGAQKRPNIHIEDISDLYVELLDMPADMIAGKTFNAAYQNHTVAQLGELVRGIVSREMPQLGPITMETVPSNDTRSYHVSSEKIKRELGWAPQRTIEDAVVDLCAAFRTGRIPDPLNDVRYYNVKTIQASGLA